MYRMMGIDSSMMVLLVVLMVGCVLGVCVSVGMVYDRYDRNRAKGNRLRISGIAYGTTSFDCVMVMILVDGEWRAATSGDIPYLPSWQKL